LLAISAFFYELSESTFTKTPSTTSASNSLFSCHKHTHNHPPIPPERLSIFRKAGIIAGLLTCGTLYYSRMQAFAALEQQAQFQLCL
jgi:hypothetical protein